MHNTIKTSLISLAFLSSLSAIPVFADDAPPPDFDTSAMLTGDWGGARETLHKKGVDLGATYIGEALGNVSGGTNRGVAMEGRLEVAASFNLEQIFDWKGVSAFANMYQLHGRGNSATQIGNLMTTSNIEATKTTRLFDLWLEKNFEESNISIRVGQLAADDEFTTSTPAATFINSVFGWPTSLATNLTSGGPAFPLAAPGARLKISDGGRWTNLTAIFDGDPGGHGTEANPQQRNISGTSFNLDRGALIMNELAYSSDTTKDDAGLPTVLKLGLWYHTENFADLRKDNTGLSLASTGSSGVAKNHHGNYGVYAVVDQTLWKSDEADEKSIVGFTRLFWNPEDRNQINFQIDGGINVHGLIPARHDDVLGIGFSYLGISNSASGLDRDTNFFNATSAPVRDYEGVVEVTYQTPITPWFSLQPDFQYILHPGGNITNPNIGDGVTPIKDATIFGLRAVARF